MDTNRFDQALRAWSEGPSRRAVARALAGLAFAGPLSALLGLAEAEAGKNKKHKKKGKKRNRKTATCTDGVRNGTESDIDCGGDCRRCGFGKICSGPADCASAFCANDTCQSCGGSDQCGEDAHGTCFCEQVEGGSACNSSVDPVAEVSSCDECESGLNCLDLGNVAVCVVPCGAS